MLPGFEQRFDNVFANGATCLVSLGSRAMDWSGKDRNRELTPTIATLVTWFLKPCGCLLAYCSDILRIGQRKYRCETVR